MAYADGQLEQSKHVEVETALAASPELQRKFKLLQESAILLKESLSVENEETPSYIAARIKSIEARANKENEIAPNGNTNNKLFSFFSWEYIVSVAASFGAGVALILTILSPVAPALISLRGADAACPEPGLFLCSQIIQNNSTIYNGGSISARMPFNLTILLPIDGIVTLTETTDISQGVIYGPEMVMAGRFFTFPTMQVADQTQLVFRINLSDGTTDLSHTINFSVE